MDSFHENRATMQEHVIPDDAEAVRLYYYDPSLVGNSVIAALFGLAAVVHLWMIIRTRAWFFTPFVLGCVCECGGYLSRVVSAMQTPDWTQDTFVIQTLFLLLGPLMFAAAIYMTLGRLTQALEATHHSFIPVSWLTKIFLFGDFLSILSQAAGGGMLSRSKTLVDFGRANDVIVLGLVIQVVFFTIFVIVTVIFHIRIRREPTPKCTIMATPWERFIYILYASSAIVLVRCAFRIAEFAMDPGNELQSKEAYMFVFDGIIIFLLALLFGWTHPAYVMVGYDRLRRTKMPSTASDSDGQVMSDVEMAGYQRQLA